MDQARARALLDEERARLRRLVADPLSELTVEEAAAVEAGEFDLGDEGEALGPAGHPYEVLDDADITPEEQHAGDEDVDEPPPEPEPGLHVERDDGGHRVRRHPAHCAAGSHGWSKRKTLKASP